MCLLGRRLAMNVPVLLDASWLEHVCRAVAWQSVDQIRYNTEKKMFWKYEHKIFYLSDSCNDSSCGDDAAADDDDGDRLS
jgi:hypothetical protein